jgi:hypothetical protein
MWAIYEKVNENAWYTVYSNKHMLQPAQQKIKMTYHKTSCRKTITFHVQSVITNEGSTESDMNTKAKFTNTAAAN